MTFRERGYRCLPPFLCLFLVFLFPAAYSQHYSYTHYDFKDGLSGITVNGMAQDRDGFIWMTTETGLSIFDGTRFRNFRREDGLPSNEVFAAFVDSRNRVWLTTYKNAVCYFYKGKLHNQQNDPVLKKVNLKSEISGLAEDAQGNILLLSENNRVIIISPGGSVVSYKNGDRGNPSGFKIDAGEGFNFDWKMAKTSYQPAGWHGYVAHAKDHNFEASGGILLLKHPKEVIVVKKDQFVTRLEMSRGARVKPINDSIIAVLGDTTGGANFYNVNRQKYVARYLPDYTVHDVFRDREGNLWFSTKESGVFKLNPATFQSFPFGENGHPVAVVSLFKIGNGLFANTGNNRCWQLTSVNPLQFREVASGGWKALLFQLGRQGYLPQMIAYSGSDFLRLNQPTRTVKSVMVLGDTLLISTNSNVMLLRYPGQQLLRELHSGRSTCSFKVREDYYIGTLNGLYRIDSSGREFFIGKDYPPLRDRISSFTFGADSILWIATYENGIVGYRDGKVVVNITKEKSGLSSNICRCICSDGKVLWVGTENGLNRVEKRTGSGYRTTRKFTMADGLTSDIVNAVYVEGDQVFAGTSDGLVHFDNSKAPQHGLCRLYLTDMRVSDRQLDVDSNRFVLSHQHNNISFEFAALSFLSEDDITYIYRLKGLENDWRKVQTPVLTYPSLPSGKYRLEVIAINKFNDSSAVLARDFEVSPRLTERKWFQALLLFAVAGCGALVLHLRIRTIQRKTREKNEIHRQIMALEQAALRAQMNPHFIFNCLNSIQHYIMRRDMMQVSVYLSKFANLVRQTLDNAPRLYLLLREELDYLENYLALEKLQMGENLEYTIWVDPALDKEKVRIPNMIIQPFVENAIKHGAGQLPSGARLQLRFYYLPGEQLLRCVIEDNGPGFRLTQELQQKNKRRHVPKGLSITRSRIETLSQISDTKRKITIEIEEITPEAKHKGARVIIHFPL